MAVGLIEEPPAGLQVREVPAPTYAAFPSLLPAIDQTYRYIFGEWQSTSGYVVDPGKFAFEQYPPGAETNAPALIHIPIDQQEKASTPVEK